MSLSSDLGWVSAWHAPEACQDGEGGVSGGPGEDEWVQSFAAVQREAIRGHRSCSPDCTTSPPPPMLLPSSHRKSRSRSKKKDSRSIFPRTPVSARFGRGSSSSAVNNESKVAAKRSFAESFSKEELILVDLDTSEPVAASESATAVAIPSMLHAFCSRLRKDMGLGAGAGADAASSSPALTEGLFRKAGSAARQKALREQLAAVSSDLDAVDAILSEAAAVDVAALLKHWLRNLEGPVLTLEVQDKLVQDYTLFHDESSSTASDSPQGELLCCLLLSLLHLPRCSVAALSYVLRFLADVSSLSSHHKMDASNLAIIFTPTLFFSLMPPPQADIARQTKVLEMLINHADKIGCLPRSLVDDLGKHVATKRTEQKSSVETSCLEDDSWCAPAGAGPSERRRRKRKKDSQQGQPRRRSGSISRVLSATMSTVRGLHSKVMSRVNTPAPGGGADDSGIVTRSRVRGGYDQPSVHRTPFPDGGKDLYDSSFHCASTSKKGKKDRKKAQAEERLNSSMSPNLRRKRAKMDDGGASPSTTKLDFTPHRHRNASFSVKSRFKRKKRLQSKDLEEDQTAVQPTEEGSFSVLASKPCLSALVKTPSTPRSLQLPKQGCDIDSPMVVQADADEVEECGVVLGNMEIGVRRRSSVKSLRTGAEAKKKMVSTRSLTRLTSSKSSRSSLHPKDEGKSAKQEEEEEREEEEEVTPPPKPRSRRQSRRASAVSSSKHNESLVNLRQDINSVIEKSFGTESEKKAKPEAPRRTSPLLPQPMDDFYNRYTRMRRQSSAMECGRKMPLTNPYLAATSAAASSSAFRRQSSAFEIRPNPADEVYTIGSRAVPTRASLRRRNSSVKDLVKRLEKKSSPLPPPLPSQPPPQSQEEEKEEEDWVDASKFFNGPPSALPRHMDVGALAGGSASKRSSIIKIRQENKGLVSKSVETFTKPQTPSASRIPAGKVTSAVKRSATVSNSLRAAGGPPQPALSGGAASRRSFRQPQPPPPVALNDDGASRYPTPRRLSARMGVGALTPLQSTTGINRPGIRTTTAYKKRSTPNAATPVKKSLATTPKGTATPTARTRQLLSKTSTAAASPKKYVSSPQIGAPRHRKQHGHGHGQRRGGAFANRRHKTIIGGCSGEIRGLSENRFNAYRAAPEAKKTVDADGSRVVTRSHSVKSDKNKHHHAHGGNDEQENENLYPGVQGRRRHARVKSGEQQPLEAIFIA